MFWRVTRGITIAYNIWGHFISFTCKYPKILKENSNLQTSLVFRIMDAQLKSKILGKIMYQIYTRQSKMVVK